MLLLYKNISKRLELLLILNVSFLILVFFKNNKFF